MWVISIETDRALSEDLTAPPLLAPPPPPPPPREGSGTLGSAEGVPEGVDVKTCDGEIGSSNSVLKLSHKGSDLQGPENGRSWMSTT